LGARGYILHQSHEEGKKMASWQSEIKKKIEIAKHKKKESSIHSVVT